MPTTLESWRADVSQTVAGSFPNTVELTGLFLSRSRDRRGRCHDSGYDGRAGKNR